MPNPKLTIPWEPIDWLLEVIGALAALFLLFYPLLQYGSLPEEIPMHFNLRGVADSYWSKAGIWGLTAIALATYIVLWFLNKSPHLFNYSGKVTAENAFSQYQLSTRMMRITNVVTVSFFAFILYEIIEVSLGRQAQINNTVSYVFLSLLLGIPLVYLLVNWRRYKP
jgi:uncharacterized membrane protein